MSYQGAVQGDAAEAAGETSYLEHSGFEMAAAAGVLLGLAGIYHCFCRKRQTTESGEHSLPLQKLQVCAFHAPDCCACSCLPGTSANYAMVPLSTEEDDDDELDYLETSDHPEEDVNAGGGDGGDGGSSSVDGDLNGDFGAGLPGAAGGRTLGSS